MMGRNFVYADNGKVIGYNLGVGGYNEHNFYSNEERLEFTENFNMSYDAMGLRLLNPNEFNTIEYLRTFLRSQRKGMQVLKRNARMYQRKKSPAYQLTPFVLRPNINVYERKVVISNTQLGGKCLQDGTYHFLSIEGAVSQGMWKQKFQTKLENRRKFDEYELLYAPDYKDSWFTSLGCVASSYSTGSDNLLILIKEEGMYEELYHQLKQSLESGNLAVVADAWKVRGLQLIFLDVLDKNNKSVK